MYSTDSPALVAKAKEQFREDTRDTPYFSFLPAEAKPPLELNREMMERFRPEMRKHYLNRTPRFN
jgi:aminobenzoyl-glutamate utilization protein B